MNFLLGWSIISLISASSFKQMKRPLLSRLLFGVPQGSILRRFIFNLYVSDLQKHTKCPCYQDAHDTTFQLSTQRRHSRLGDYSSESNLGLHVAKTKWMLVSSRQMSRAHTLKEYYPDVNEKLLERVATAKILGIHTDEHLTWADHVTALLSSCYAALAVLKKLRNLAPYRIRKQLLESLVMSKLEYRCVVFHPLSDYLMKRLQRVETTYAVYVLGRYAVLEDLQKLNWLPIIERRDLVLLKMTHKALYDVAWPDHLRLKLHTVSTYNLRSLEAPKWAIPTESGTFQDSAPRLFNTLPDELKQESNYDKFVRLTKKVMLSKGGNRTTDAL